MLVRRKRTWLWLQEPLSGQALQSATFHHHTMTSIPTYLRHASRHLNHAHLPSDTSYVGGD